MLRVNIRVHSNDEVMRVVVAGVLAAAAHVLMTFRLASNAHIEPVTANALQQWPFNLVPAALATQRLPMQRPLGDVVRQWLPQSSRKFCTERQRVARLKLASTATGHCRRRGVCLQAAADELAAVQCLNLAARMVAVRTTHDTPQLLQPF
jgi:hypothetical protein